MWDQETTVMQRPESTVSEGLVNTVCSTPRVKEYAHIRQIPHNTQWLVQVIFIITTYLVLLRCLTTPGCT